MRKNHLNRILAVVLTLAMALSVGFVLPVAADAPIELGYLHPNAEHPTQENGQIWVDCDNSFTSGWQNWYAESADCVKLIKSGNDAVYNIASLTEYGTSDGIIVSNSGTTFRINNSQWNLNCANQSGTSPLAHGDTMIIGGNFTAASTGIVYHISTTYITKDADGNIHCSETFETGDMTPSVHANGFQLSAEYKCYDESGWHQFYASDASNVKMFRNGTVTNIGALTEYGTTDGIIYNLNGNELVLRNTQWALNCSGHSNLSPMQAGDVIYFGGTFTTSAGNTLHVKPSYLYKDAQDNLTISDGYNVGTLSADSTHPAMQSGGDIYGIAEGGYNAGNWTEYKADSMDCVKLRKSGSDTYVSIGIPGSQNIMRKRGDNVFCIISSQYYLNLAGHSELSPLAEGDVMIVEGNFTGVSDGITAHIERTYITIVNGNLVFSTTEPGSTPTPSVIQAGVMEADSGHPSLNNGGFYFTMANNAIPYDAGWSNEFYATSADVIKLIRGGGTEASAVAIAQTSPGRAPFIKYSQSGYYFNGSDAWHLGSSAPLQNGDILIVEGEFTNGTTTFNVSKSVIIIGSDGSLTFGTTVPTIINGGLLAADVNEGSLLNSRDFYFSMAANDLPADSTWSTRYYPSSADCIKLTRNGTTTSVGNTQAGTILKFDTTRYYMALDTWAYPNAQPQPGDILTIEGDFTLGSTTLRITKTYITVNWDGTLTFSAAQPTAPVKPFADTQNYPVAIWNGSFHTFGMKQMYDLRMAGINEIIGITPYWLGSNDTERNNKMNELLDLAAFYGIKVYPSLDVFDGSGNASMWDGVTVPGYNTQHSAIAGFLVKDEPTLSEINTLGTLKTAYDALPAFAGKTFYVNLHPQSSTSVIVGSSYETYVNNFISAVNPDVIGVDVYPINSSGDARKVYFSNLAMLADKAQQIGAKLQYTMLSCGHNTGSTSYNAPSAALMRWQTDVALAFGVDGLAHYTYASHESNYNTFANTSGNIINQSLYNNIATAGNEHLAWLDLYSQYTWQGTAAVNNDSNRMINRMSSYAASLPSGTTVTSTGDVLIGIFDKNGEKAYMITNAGSASLKSIDPLDRETTTGFYDFSMSAVTVTLTMSGCDMIEVISEGVTSYIAKSGSSFTIPVAAYEGVFVRPHTHVYENGVCVCGDAVPRIVSASLKLDEDIDVIYAVSVPAGCTNPYMVINGTTITASEVSGDYRLFTYTGITPQRMTDNISATLYATKNGQTVSTSVAEYSVKQYCANQLTAHPNDAELVTLLSDLLTYGAAAQNYTGYKTNDLATSGLTLSPSTFSAISGKTVSFTGTADPDTFWTEATLVLGNTVGIRLYFVTDAQLSIDVTINGSTETFDSGFVACGNGEYYLDIPGIQATDFDTTVTAEFYDNGVKIGNTLGYSVNTYICGTQNTSNATLQALVRALYNYGASAAAYAD